MPEAVAGQWRRRAAIHPAAVLSAMPATPLAAQDIDADAPPAQRQMSDYATIDYNLQEDRDNILFLDLSNGQRVAIRLMPDWAPHHVERIKTLARQGFYDGVIFHRVIDGFMAQTGDPTSSTSNSSSAHRTCTSSPVCMPGMCATRGIRSTLSNPDRRSIGTTASVRARTEATVVAALHGMAHLGNQHWRDDNHLTQQSFLSRD